AAAAAAAAATQPGEHDVATSGSTSAEQAAVQQERLFQTLRKRFQRDYRDNLVQFSHWGLLWLQIGLWYGASVWIVSIHPALMRWRGWILATPVEIILAWFFYSLAIRLSYALIDRFTRVWSRTDFLTGLLPLEEVQRKELRAVTIAGVLRGVAFAGFITLAIIDTLETLNIPTRSLLAGGAVLALAISFGAQSLVKDLVNGCLILIEDQFAVGDVIDLGHTSGLVEDLNLRITQIRDASGALITLPNSSITQVKNLTRLWSRVDFSIEIAYDADVRRALAVLKDVGDQMFGEAEWRDRLLNPPEVLGIDHLAHTGILLRVWLKTAPLQQWAVGREYRYRVRLAFEAEGIAIGRPQWINYTADLSAVPTLAAAAEVAPDETSCQ
ncbi:MAG: mechanosensitive ion channel family protein, partial [Spirulinaceae cyanobacterium SM2_1_0]|nr:mechanosensitive ion channel family protein [Spirulinaceae cyanobacterium SM2_1_0]